MPLIIAFFFCKRIARGPLVSVGHHSWKPHAPVHSVDNEIFGGGLVQCHKLLTWDCMWTSRGRGPSPQKASHTYLKGICGSRWQYSEAQRGCLSCVAEGVSQGSENSGGTLPHPPGSCLPIRQLPPSKHNWSHALVAYKGSSEGHGGWAQPFRPTEYLQKAESQHLRFWVKKPI